MKKTCLITGGAGFIGSHLVSSLINDTNIICVDNFDDFYDESVKRKNIAEHIKHPNYRLFETDITDYNQLKDIFENNEISYIVHLAAKAGVRPSIQQPLNYISTNINGTTNLLELAAKFGIKKFVFGSSSSVYGIRKDGPFNEEMKIDQPISPYAATKAAGEQLCFTYSHLYNINITCLRFFTVYGPGQRPDLAIHKFSKLMLDNKPLSVFGDGSAIRDYTFVDDIIQGIIGAINYNDTLFEIFNLGESQTVKLNYLIDLLEENLKMKAIREYHPIQPGDVPITYADISKARKLLGYNPSTPIEKGLEIFARWFDGYYR